MRNKLLVLPALTILLIGLTIGGIFLSESKNTDINQVTASNQPQQIAGTKSQAYQEENNALPVQTNNDQNPGNLQSVIVTRVIDGDTIEIEGGIKVRYIGIDTPETVDPRTSVQCFGKEASSKNRELVDGKTVQLEKDVSETDKYGRLLRYIYIGDTFVNDYLVRNGYAYASSYPPDVKYQDLFSQAQNDAHQNNRGLWGGCKEGSDKTSSAANYNKEGCNIKGNISSSNEKIYHTPGQKYYDKTVIDETKGERWFCTENDATSAGWRKSKI